LEAQYNLGVQEMQLRTSAEQFKQNYIYPSIAEQDPAEVWLFLKGLTEAAFGFSKWQSSLKQQTIKPAQDNSETQGETQSETRVRNEKVSSTFEIKDCSAMFIASQEAYSTSESAKKQRKNFWKLFFSSWKCCQAKGISIFQLHVCSSQHSLPHPKDSLPVLQQAAFAVPARASSFASHIICSNGICMIWEYFPPNAHL
jgi:hypothetical protein